MKLSICAATMEDTDTPGEITTWMAKSTLPRTPWIWDNSEVNIGVVGAYQKLYETTTEDILFYLHDDVVCREDGWDQRILKEFEQHPDVGVVGCGGALNHGSDDLYKRPYELTQLARSGYLSNTDDAEEHGQRFDGVRDVAVVDGFAIAVRRTLLDRCGGFHPDIWPPHHLYDYVICAQAHRYGYRVRVVGIRCHHHGGRTATSNKYQEWARTTEWGSDVEMHRKGHKMFYDEFKDVLPYRVRS